MRGNRGLLVVCGCYILTINSINKKMAKIFLEKKVYCKKNHSGSNQEPTPETPIIYSDPKSFKFVRLMTYLFGISQPSFYLGKNNYAK